jgi:large subunit ribosomal protein L30
MTATPETIKKTSGRAKSAGQVKLTLERSLYGQLKNIASSVRGLGLRRRHQSVTVADTAENRGMINVASHMLKVERS